jgi:hypothetical protein
MNGNHSNDEADTPITTVGDSPSTQRAIRIPHILKTIICQLHTFEIKRAQGVCREWRRIIQSSKQIQQAHVLRPSESIPVHETKRYEAYGIPYLPPFKNDITYWASHYSTTYDITIHPALSPYIWRQDTDKVRGFELKTSILQKYRRKFATRPQCAAVGLHSLDYSPDGSLQQFVTVYNPTGVKIGDILDVMNQVKQQAAAVLDYKSPGSFDALRSIYLAEWKGGVSGLKD